jgi:hypothetical protein
MNDAYENSMIYKEKTKVFHDKMISMKEFRIRQSILLIVLSCIEPIKTFIYWF